MRTAHVLRKPLGEPSVAANVLKYGPQNTAMSGFDPNTGRWPANMVLSHRAACKKVGTQRVKGNRTGTRPEDGPDKTETIERWECAPGCPIADLDGQHGGGPFLNEFGAEDARGASRFFKTVKESAMSDIPEDLLSDIPEDLLSYLHDLIAPTHLDDCKVIVSTDPLSEDWGAVEDETVHGAILLTPTDPTELSDDLQEHLWRVLKPGAHVILISPESEPTGHTAACIMEDLGFEVRDAILWVREGGKLHYVPKPTQAERHAGCEHLKLRRREREEEKDGLGDVGEVLVDGVEVETPEDEQPGNDLDERNAHKGNIHPTVKSKQLMARLMADIPTDATVLDPFMGSGSTALACLDTGHEFIGIEMEGDYLEIADARVRHWDRNDAAWSGATIESEAPSLTKPKDTLDLDDFFDL